jgi:hypothetical protein
MLIRTNVVIDDLKHFIEHLYYLDWSAQSLASARDVEKLASLYTMGDRLIALNFQREVFRHFVNAIQNPSYSPAIICKLLRIACEIHPKDHYDHPQGEG